MSPLGATVIKRGSLKSVAKMFTRKPGGTLGKKPSGGLVSSGGFPDDRVAKGAGSFGFRPLVTCAPKSDGRKSRTPTATANGIRRDMISPKDKVPQRALLARMTQRGRRVQIGRWAKRSS